MNLPIPVLFAMATGLFWGLYGPAVAQSRAAESSPFKPYVMIGVAYLIWGILGGLIGMKLKGDDFSQWTGKGITWGFIGGTLGAFGALTLTLAMFKGGVPHVVMPTVFGTAVTVSAIYGVATSRAQVNPMLYVGIVGLAICMVMVAYFTPHGAPKPPTAAKAETATADAGAH
jgi:hypothetical protein